MNPFLISALFVEDSAVIEFFLLILTIYLLYSKVLSIFWLINFLEFHFSCLFNLRSFCVHETLEIHIYGFALFLDPQP
jgi:hypothetical protein